MTNLKGTAFCTKDNGPTYGDKNYKSILSYEAKDRPNTHKQRIQSTDRHSGPTLTDRPSTTDLKFITTKQEQARITSTSKMYTILNIQ